MKKLNLNLCHGVICSEISFSVLEVAWKYILKQNKTKNETSQVATEQDILQDDTSSLGVTSGIYGKIRFSTFNCNFLLMDVYYWCSM